MSHELPPPEGDKPQKPDPDEFGQIQPEPIKPGDPKSGMPPFEISRESYYIIESERYNFTSKEEIDLAQYFSRIEESRPIRMPRFHFHESMLENVEKYYNVELPYAGPGTGYEKEIAPEPEPVFEPDPYPSRAGWRTPFVGTYEPVPVAEPERQPKVKIGDYEVTESDVGFEDIGGNQRAKGLLTEIALQFADPEVHTKWDDPVPKGVLFYGRPGTGKTMLAKAFAKEADATFIAIPVAQLRDKYYGETEKNLENLFKEAGKHDGPVVIFFDEIDSLLVDRTGVHPSHPDAQMVNAFLQAMDGMKSAKNVMVLGATNYPERLDAAAIRPGRFDRKVEVELPDKAACGEILARRLLAAERRVGRALVEDELNIEKLSEYLEGASGADIAEIVNRVKNTMARTERAIKKPFEMTEADKPNDSDVVINFNAADVSDLLIQADDIIGAIINYRLNG